MDIVLQGLGLFCFIIQIIQRLLLTCFLLGKIFRYVYLYK